MVPKRPLFQDEPSSEEEGSSEGGEAPKTSTLASAEMKPPNEEPVASGSEAQKKKKKKKRPSSRSDSKQEKKNKKVMEAVAATAAVTDEKQKRPLELELDDEAAEVEEQKKHMGAIQRKWTDDDEIALLEGMISYGDPFTDMNAFYDFIKKSIHFDVSKTQLVDKIRRLKKRYVTGDGKSRGQKFDVNDPHHAKLNHLAMKIWRVDEGQEPRSNINIGNGSNPDPHNIIQFGNLPLVFEGLNLPQHVMETGLGFLSESKKAKLDEQWKKVHMTELKLYMTLIELRSELSKLILDALAKN